MVVDGLARCGVSVARLCEAEGVRGCVEVSPSRFAAGDVFCGPVQCFLRRMLTAVAGLYYKINWRLKIRSLHEEFRFA